MGAHHVHYRVTYHAPRPRRHPLRTIARGWARLTPRGKVIVASCVIVLGILAAIVGPLGGSPTVGQLPADLVGENGQMASMELGQAGFPTVVWTNGRTGWTLPAAPAYLTVVSVQQINGVVYAVAQ